jgi:hypothetical protein
VPVVPQLGATRIWVTMFDSMFGAVLVLENVMEPASPVWPTATAEGIDAPALTPTAAAAGRLGRTIPATTNPRTAAARNALMLAPSTHDPCGRTLPASALQRVQRWFPPL